VAGGPVATSESGAWVRLAALTIATFAVLCGIAAILIARQGTIASDFLSFWAAGRLAVQGHAADAYDIVRHHAVEAQAVAGVGLLPFPYPPFALALFVPFGMLPFWAAFAAWIAITAALYLVATRRWVEPRFALAQAAAAANFIIGQNGFLTSGIFIGGTTLIARRPLLAGVILGLLALKPQLALLLPVALIAGREWRAIAGGVLSSVALVAIGFLLFGAGGYSAFLAVLPQFSGWLAAGRWPWGELASTFALLRWFGMPETAALVVHGAVALAAAAFTARAWALKLDQRVPILAAATLLVPPYLFTYDALLLTLPLAALLRQRRKQWVVPAIWLLTLLPAIAYLRPFPNTIPVAAMLTLWALHAERRESDTDVQPMPLRAVTRG
jgi:hypothetical protein